MSKIKLKSCPKCSSVNVRICDEKMHPNSLLDGEICYIVICDECWIKTSKYVHGNTELGVHTRKHAAKIWNNRS